MTPSGPTAEPFTYDVAFSFLSRDLPLARQIADHLAGLRVFLYDRNKEQLLGGDGMDRFTEVFGSTARLAVILYREGWGTTAWTAVEENAIKGRALKTRYTSFMAVLLDDSELPTWIPSQYLYASTAADTVQEMAAVIRARARETGAVIRKESMIDAALKRTAEARAAQARKERENSRNAIEEITASATTLFEAIAELVRQIKERDPAYPLAQGHLRDRCVVSGGGMATGIALYLSGVVRSPHNFILSVNDWGADHHLPTPQQPDPGGHRLIGSTHYSPTVLKNDEWGWRWEPNAESGGIVLPRPRRATGNSTCCVSGMTWTFLSTWNSK